MKFKELELVVKKHTMRVLLLSVLISLIPAFGLSLFSIPSFSLIIIAPIIAILCVFIASLIIQYKEQHSQRKEKLG